MKDKLELGTTMSGGKFTLPREAVLRTFAWLGIRGSGKTTGATVMAEEMCEAGLPWVALDPVGVWWGLRVNADGTPGGYPVVVFGGQHADLPLDKHQGAKIAEAILEQNVCCVIDLSGESKNVWRQFVTEFCDHLMTRRPVVPRHIFIEESPEFVPQRPMGEQKRSLAAVDRLGRLGRNNGYGLSLLSQRYATIQKDVLCECENLFALRMIGKPDRESCRDWIAEVVHETDEKKAREFYNSLATLDSGVAWFWSPQWLQKFIQVRIRRRKTFHPGETRTLGETPKQVALSDVREFVDRFSKILGEKEIAPSEGHQGHGGRYKGGRQSLDLAGAGDKPLRDAKTWMDRSDGLFAENTGLREENARLLGEVSRLRQELSAARTALEAVRKAMEPEYRAMQKLFGDLESVPSATGGGAVDAGVFDPWKQKLAGSPAKLIDVLLSRGECTKPQLQTLCALGRESLRVAISKLNVNGLIEKDGDKIRLRVP